MAPLALHRDTWATNLYAQINWWAPVFPVESSRTMNLYPDLWAKPVPNDSESFDLPRTMARGRENMVAMRASEAVPHATAEVDTRSSRSEERVVGKECVSTGRSRGSPYPSKKK